jgi:hypothetical protein
MQQHGSCRLAEAHFQTMLVQLAKEDLGEALKSCKAAANQLRARKDEVSGVFFSWLCVYLLAGWLAV